MTVLPFILFVNFVIILNVGNSAPNIIFFLTDDQDITLGGMSMMPKATKLLTENGLSFSNAFVHSPICCISRASILSGRYVHNHNTINNSISGNCDGPEWRQNTESSCYAAYVGNANYNTMYAGKYLNTYGINGNAGGVAWIPQGWTDWFGLVGNSAYYGRSISNNGTVQSYGQQYISDYYTNILREQALSFLDLQTKDKPFLMVVATPAAHAPFEPAPQYANTASNLKAPRTPNWNNVATSPTKHQLMQETPALNPTMIEQSDQTWRFRLGTLLSVDDLVEAVFNKVEKMGNEIFDNTYFIYTSDHGFHLGQYGMGYDKRQLYENDIRIPFIIRGPNVPKNKTTDIFALNVDIAPTIVDLTTGTIPNEMDGMSLVPIINGTLHSNIYSGIDQQFLIEYYGEQYNAKTGISMCGGYPGYEATVCDMWNNTYQCVRQINGTNNELNGTIYCQFKCYLPDRSEVTCPANTPQGQGEYYNLDNDYYELNNLWTTLNPSEINGFKSQIKSFMDCKGQTSCNSLRLGKKMKHYWQYIKNKLI